MTEIEQLRSERRAIVALALAQGILFATLGIARWATFHNETFDLAFYTRIAWGLAHNDHWEPIVNAHFYGLRLSPALAPLGLIGTLFGTAPVLIVAQAAALAGAAFPLARIGREHLGGAGAIGAAIVWLFSPNLGHVAGYEVHAGSMAALPLAWMAWSLDRGNVRGLVLSALGALACREDLAIVVTIAAALFAWRHRARWRTAVAVSAGSFAYLLFFLLYLHPRYAPETGSLELHFGRFGTSTSEVVLHLVTHPLELLAYLGTPERLLYLPKVLAPLALLPLLSPRWLLPAAPILAINLVSAWPTTTDLGVHYLTPALPFLVAGAIEGAARLRAPSKVAGVLVAAALVAHVMSGGTPLSLDFVGEAYRLDESSLAARAIVDAIPAEASVQAPDALLPHLAERPVLRRAASPEAGADYLVIDVSHRHRFAGNEDLLRTIEEPIARAWLARDDHRVVAGGGDYLLLERGRSPREGRGADAIVGRADPSEGQRIAACLGVLGASLDGDVLAIELVAREPCPNDLAIRIGTGHRPRRVDLLFAGWLSPRHVARSDRLRSLHRLPASEIARIRREGLRIGALRSSGARPEHEDPTSVLVPLTREGLDQ